VFGPSQTTSEKTKYGLHRTYDWRLKDLGLHVVLDYARYDTKRPKDPTLPPEEVKIRVEPADWAGKIESR
jgi:hypothetical protein